MSTNRATWLRASRWSDRRCDRFLDRLLVRVERPLTAAAVGALAAVLIAGLVLHRRRDASRAFEPMLSQARAAHRGYGDAQPGDYVYWCIDNSGGGAGMLDGSGSQPLILVGGFPIAGGVTGGRCVHSLARVVGREPLGLKLEFVGQP